MPRTITPERMDDPRIAREDLESSLAFLRSVNRRLGGRSALISHLQRWSRAWPRGRAITLLDVATGSADLPLAALRWAESRSLDLRITAIDAHPTTLELARAHAGDHPRLTLIHLDARRLMDRFDPLSFDYVHAGLFLHHLPQIEILTVLRIMHRLARAGIVWNDLVRSSIARAAVRILTLGQPDVVRHDAIASVNAGFTRAEALDIARRVGLDYTRYRANPLTQRFTIAGEKPGAW